MSPSNLWTDSMREAWSYVKQGVDSGLSGAAALDEYRAGGGHIATGSWYELTRDYRAGGERWDTVGYLQPTDHIPESLYVPTDQQYREKYVANIGVHYIDGEGNSATKYITIESNERQTIEGITAAVGEVMGHYETDEVQSFGAISEMEFFERMDAED